MNLESGSHDTTPFVESILNYLTDRNFNRISGQFERTPMISPI